MGSQGVAMSVLSPICLISCIFIAKSAANPKFYIIETEDRPGENAPQQPFAVEHGEDYGEYTTPKSWTTTPKPKQIEHKWTTTPKPKEIDHKWTTKEHKWTTTPKPKQIDHKWTTTPDHTSSCAGCWVDAPIDGEIVDFARRKLKQKRELKNLYNNCGKDFRKVKDWSERTDLNSNQAVDGIIYKFELECPTDRKGRPDLPKKFNCDVEVYTGPYKREMREGHCVSIN